MGWSIKVKENKWRIISSITDSDVAIFKAKEDTAKFIAKEKIYDGKIEAIKILMTFPSGWYVNGRRMNTDNEEYREFFDWQKSIYILETYEECYKAIDDKLEELMR